MPSRILVARELAEVFKALAHPDRIRLVEELRDGERDVNSLAAALKLPGARVSQHLGLLRANRMVDERREGRHHYYRLMRTELAGWIVEALAFVEARNAGVATAEIEAVRRLWSPDQDPDLGEQ